MNRNHLAEYPPPEGVFSVPALVEVVNRLCRIRYALETCCDDLQAPDSPDVGQAELVVGIKSNLVRAKLFLTRPVHRLNYYS